MLTPTTARELELDSAIEQALVGGDLSRLTIAQRLEYYKAVCASLNLNPLTKPFIYITLNSKLVLYPTGDCADQLRSIHAVSIDRLEKRTEDGIYEVTAYASLPTGRKDEASGMVFIDNLKGADRANAKMKCETKAKRRVTMSLIGLNGYAGIELPNDDEIKYREVGVDHSPEITAREQAARAERAARGPQEWIEELDEPTFTPTHVPRDFADDQARGAFNEGYQAGIVDAGTKQPPPVTITLAPTIPIPSHATRESFFAYADQIGMKKEALRIANSHSKSPDWQTSMQELIAVSNQPQTA